jgi:hypothetical protein
MSLVRIRSRMVDRRTHVVRGLTAFYGAPRLSRRLISRSHIARFTMKAVPLGGVLVTCVETTERVIGERRLKMLRELGTDLAAITTQR